MLLTNKYSNTATPMTTTFSNTAYGYVGVARYILAVIFALLLAQFFFAANAESAQSQENIKSRQ
jgi:hypothetical protein